MKVLVDATPLASGHRWRGIGRYVRHLVRGVAERLPPDSDFLTIGREPDSVPSGRAVSLSSSLPPRWKDFWPFYTRSLPALVTSRGYSIYHFTSAETSTAQNGFKKVATVYDLIPFDSGRPRSLHPLDHWRYNLYMLYLRNLAAADHIIAISESTSRDLQERLSIPLSRITVIPLGIDREDYTARADRMRGSLRLELGLPKEYWLTITSPNPNKGWRDAIKGLSLARASGLEIPLAIAGYWLPKQRQALMKVEARLGVSDLIHFLGYVDDGYLPALYSASLGFLFASLREGFGLPVLEAMALGAPAIVSDEPAVIELVGPAALSFPRGRPESLSEQMVRLASDATLRARLRAAGLDRSARYNWGTMVDRTVAVYRTL
jgi:glycosyltransferase involved in cell wall biosynthesis